MFQEMTSFLPAFSDCFEKSFEKKHLAKNHGENAGTHGMVPLIINPIYTLCSGYLLDISPFKGLLGGLNS